MIWVIVLAEYPLKVSRLLGVIQVGEEAWYGGGCDLTPAYISEKDAIEFHTFWQTTCDAHEVGPLSHWP